MADQEAILDAVLEIYPPKCEAPEITNIAFYVDMNLESGSRNTSSIRHMESVVELFYSYPHRDEELRNELDKHLSILKRQGVIDGWHDRRILAGKEWEGEIDEHLNTAHVVLLLISSDFIASDYCYDVEMKRAMERHEAGEALVIPILTLLK